jgi:hypothetical protein
LSGKEVKMAAPSIDETLAQQYQPGTDLGDQLRNENIYLNAENKPNIPAAKTEDVTPPETPLGWSERLADAANQIGVLPGVGGWAKSLVASAVQALPKRPSRASQVAGAAEGVGRSLGDIAAIGTVPSGGGTLTGIGRTLAARGERQQQEKRQAVLNDYTAAQTVSLQRNAQHLELEDQLTHEKSGQVWKAGLEKNHEKVADGITEQELMDGIKKGTLNTSDYQYQQTGHTLVPQNGKMVSIPTYSVFKKSDTPHEITPEEAAFLKQNGQVDTNGKEIPAGAKLGGDLFDHAWTAAMASQSSRLQLEKTERDYNLNKIETENKTQKAKDEAAVSSLMGQIQAQHPGMNAVDSLGIISKNSAPAHASEAQAASRLLGQYDPKELDAYQKQRFEERKQSETERHNKAEEAINRQKEKDKAEGGSTKPVYAYNNETKQLEQTTKGDVAANPTRYTNPVDIKESDIRKDTDLARQLGDAQLNLSRYRAAAQGLDTLGMADSRAVAALIGDDKFKAEFMGAQIPTDWLNKLLTQENWKMLPKAAQDAVIGYIGARGAVVAYQKAVSGSGRSNKEQLELELQNIPNPLLPKDVRERQFDRFQQNIDQTGAGLPKMVGIERPKEIRQRIETEETQKQADAAKQQGATHVYDPNSRRIIPADATPVKNWKGQIIGYQEKNSKDGQWVRFPQ